MVSIWRLYEDIGLVVRQNTFDSMIWTVIKKIESQKYIHATDIWFIGS